MIKDAPLLPASLLMLNPNGRVVCAAANQCEWPEPAEVGGMRVRATPDARSTFVGSSRSWRRSIQSRGTTGDKIQIATVALAAYCAKPPMLVIATNVGMLLADRRAVFIGDKLELKIPMKPGHTAAAAIFAGLDLSTSLSASVASYSAQLIFAECCH